MRRNPDWLRLLGVLFISFMLFCLGPVKMNAKNVERHDYAYSMNSPPGNNILAIKEIQQVEFTMQPGISIQIVRGVSVPLKELTIAYPGIVMQMNSQEMIYYNNYNQLNYPLLVNRYDSYGIRKTDNQRHCNNINNFRAREKI